MNDQAQKWNQKYQQGAVEQDLACYVLTAYQHLLPVGGTALDVACGLGGNAIFLAQHSLDTRAWDISKVALGKLQAYADAHQLPITTEVRDIDTEWPPGECFDVIVVSRYLQRSVVHPMCQALNRNGLLFYQTFIQAKVDDIGPSNPQYLLDTNELLRLFSSLQVVAYREEARIGDLQQGFRNEAYLVAMRSS